MVGGGFASINVYLYLNDSFFWPFPAIKYYRAPVSPKKYPKEISQKKTQLDKQGC